MSTVVVSDAAKAFDRRVLFEHVSFKVEPARLTALTGASGSGKSTLMNCLGLLDRLTKGSVIIDDVDVSRLGSEGRRKFRRDTLGYLFQSYALIENASIRENLDVAVAAQKRPGRSLFDDALERVGLGGRDKEPVYRLSGGEQQRVALARLIVKRPTVILADEPTGALDDANAHMVVDLLQQLADDGAAVVIATHSATVVDSCAEVIRLGR